MQLPNRQTSAVDAALHRPDHARFVSALDTPQWTRRTWVTGNIATMFMAATRLQRPGHRSFPQGSTTTARRVAHASQADPRLWQTLAQQAVDAAQHAGAQYADVRVTRTTQHLYGFNVPSVPFDLETVGIGIRALVHGYWGFAACPIGEVMTGDGTVTGLAASAVAQAQTNAADGTVRTVEMGIYPKVVGTWATPVVIDPFSVSIEEKGAYIDYWLAWAKEQGVSIDTIEIDQTYLSFMRQERVVATSDGSLVTQTSYESGGSISCKSSVTGDQVSLDLDGLQTTGRGWELFATEAKIPEQLTGMLERLKAEARKQTRPATVGRYTLVCDGATMAALVGQTLGIATQLDRALGYEANAGGTSFLDDPLAMVGSYHAASRHVTVTANRSVPTQLATVKWDDEGVVPEPFTLIKDGVLVDFQTTREQAAWLAPYYQQHGAPVRSHGCALSQDALCLPLQQRPNLALEPQGGTVHLTDLIADVSDGILVENGRILNVDFQGRTGLLVGDLRKVTNGRLGASLTGGAVLFDTLDLFRQIVAVGGPTTTRVVSFTHYDPFRGFASPEHPKGQPSQFTSYSVQGVAATILNQPLIDPSRKA